MLYHDFIKSRFRLSQVEHTKSVKMFDNVR